MPGASFYRQRRRSVIIIRILEMAALVTAIIGIVLTSIPSVLEAAKRVHRDKWPPAHWRWLGLANLLVAADLRAYIVDFRPHPFVPEILGLIFAGLFIWIVTGIAYTTLRSRS
jgi:hypothetical protein